ncbi:hypothetical protein VTJ83DRAFT_2160 [Remersonia thermophila]|uniref:RSC complex subunit Rsc7 n=1 Tax=Remersonia thermophila TaxID=72144 RepID=A0ABR4DJF2_9PEZI
MYAAAQPNGADSATINPAALNTDPINSTSRGIKRGRSPEDFENAGPSDLVGDDGGDKSRKRGRPMKPRTSSADAGVVVPMPPTPQTLPPQTPQSQNAALPAQTPSTYTASQASPSKPTPTKSTLKALPTVRDHTTDQLGPGGDEYLPREHDEAGEKKVLPNGQLTGGREYRCRTFHVPNRGDKLFMLATECARVLGYRDSYLLFNKNRSLYKIIASQQEKDDLVAQEILPFSYRSRQIAIVTARSMFRQFGSRVIVNGRRVRDDYWETKARKQGFTEADPAGEKRPGASRARAEAEAASHNASMLGGPHGEIVYSTNPGQFGGAAQPQLVQPDYHDSTRSRDYSLIKTVPRQEITGPPYQDRIQPTPITELHAQAHHAAEFSRTINQQRDMRNDYMQSIWRKPHEQPPAPALNQPVTSTDASAVPSSRPGAGSHSVATSGPGANPGLQQSSMVPNHQSPMMMPAAPYSQSVHSQNASGQSTLRGSSTTLPQATSQNYSYTPSQMWPPTPQTPQHGYSAYTAHSQPSPHHPQQSPGGPQAGMRHSSSSSAAGTTGTMPYSPMPGIGQGYGVAAGGPTGAAQGMYPPDQTPRQYMHQSPQPPAVTQGWSQQAQAPTQWWTNQAQ